jgi:hypothetical protein
MCNFKRINREYIVTYNNVDYIFAHSRDAWAFIFAIRKDYNND